MSDEIEKNNVMNFPSEDMDNLRILEALLFAANEPLDACLLYTSDAADE